MKRVVRRRGSGRIKGKPVRELRAADFGDNPHIRHSRGEHEHVNPKEPWEVAYQKKKRRIRSLLKK